MPRGLALQSLVNIEPEIGVMAVRFGTRVGNPVVPQRANDRATFLGLAVASVMSHGPLQDTLGEGDEWRSIGVVARPGLEQFQQQVLGMVVPVFETRRWIKRHRADLSPDEGLDVSGENRMVGHGDLPRPRRQSVWTTTRQPTNERTAR